MLASTVGLSPEDNNLKILASDDPSASNCEFADKVRTPSRF
jgi:hypothetical protein